MSEVTSKHDEIKALCKALTSAQESENKSELEDVLNKLCQVRVDEKLLRATGAGQVVGKLRNHEDSNIAVLAKKVVHKWKKDVVAANSRAAGASSTGAKSASGSQTPQPSTGQSTQSQQQQKPKQNTEKKLSQQASASSRPDSNSASSPTSGAATPASNRSGMKSSAVKPPLTRSENNGSSNALAAVSGDSADTASIAPRTAASDMASLPQTGDSTRDKCIEILYNSMASDSNADSETLAKRAAGIEQIEFNKAGSLSNAYRVRIRSLCLNLKDKNNPDLRRNIVEGDISVERFCLMTSEEMASKELREDIERIKEENLFKAKGATRVEAETGQFKCGRCKSRKCTYYQMQTRSADEPMTTFVTCTNCDNRWKFS
ncbi:transcription elongation factor TFIIS [Coemansia spiralis]|uniref:Transcription elongation factor n=2 Tax=Coemansia TaxID=4863 RepID=A0A9W8KYG0_9FUNG|nr:transcription elongation factor TFIIS [Coemansia umbellata]KAJ2624726.1 transcription elongation factor TFIIS [Coemansia sp. RSA 1358]KAJ2678269.1 transcription elongation factor TFIIS [Coemansia spiralis]